MTVMTPERLAEFERFRAAGRKMSEIAERFRITLRHAYRVSRQLGCDRRVGWRRGGPRGTLWTS